MNVYQYAAQGCVYYYDTIENYFSRKEPTLRRKIRYYLTFVLLAIFNIKYGLLTLYPDKVQLTLLKDFTLLFGIEAKLLYAMFFCLGFVGFSAKLMLAYYESRSNLKFWDIIVELKAGHPLYKLNKEHHNKLTLRAMILYYVYVRALALFTELFANSSSIGKLNANDSFLRLFEEYIISLTPESFSQWEISLWGLSLVKVSLWGLNLESFRLTIFPSLSRWV